MQPLHNYVVVEILKEDKFESDSIIINSNSNQQTQFSQKGLIVALPNKFNNLKLNDHVFFKSYAGHWCHYNKKKCKIVSFEDILAII